MDNSIKFLSRARDLLLELRDLLAVRGAELEPKDLIDTVEAAMPDSWSSRLTKHKDARIEQRAGDTTLNGRNGTRSTARDGLLDALVNGDFRPF